MAPNEKTNYHHLEGARDESELQSKIVRLEMAHKRLITVHGRLAEFITRLYGEGTIEPMKLTGASTAAGAIGALDEAVIGIEIISERIEGSVDRFERLA